MPERPATWEEVIRAEAKTARVSPELALAIAKEESDFNPTAVSPKGARGMFQLMPDTAKEMGVDPDDPLQNIRGGLNYFRKQIDTHSGDVELALQSYNWGPGNVATGGEPPAETREYVTRVLGRLGQPLPATAQRPSSPLPVPTLQQTVQGIGTPPPGGPPLMSRSKAATELAVGAPPPAFSMEAIVPEMIRGMDPTRREGRRNIAGGVGGAIGGVVAGVPGAIAGAGLAGAGLEAAEQFAGNPPPNMVGEQPSILAAGAEQAAYELGGHAILWPAKAITKRVMAAPVVRNAAKYYDDLLVDAREALQTARTTVSEAMATAAESGAVLKEKAATRAGELAGAVTRGGREAVESARAFGKEKVAEAAGGYQQLVDAPSVSMGTAGNRAIDVIKGPAAAARSEIGQMVEEAAKSGPPVDITAMKAEANRILAEELRPPMEAFPKPSAVQPGELSPAEETIQQLMAVRPNFTPEQLARAGPAAQAQYAVWEQSLNQAREAVAEDTLKHPAMQVLGRILAAEDFVPFEAAHLFKRELDEAIGTAWDRSVRNRVTNITKVMRGTLREALAGFEPYDTATKAYQQVVQPHVKGIAPKLLKAATEAPEKVVTLIRGAQDTTTVNMLREILVDQAAAGGDAKAGQYAWDSVRSAWTYQRLIRGGMAGLGDRIAKLAPEFRHAMFGDGPGQQVLSNLQAIDTAYKTAVERASAGLTEAKAVAAGAKDVAKQAGQAMRQQAAGQARAETRTVRRAGRELVQGRQETRRALGEEVRDFHRSSLVGATKSDAMVDVLRATLQGPGTLFGAVSTMRLLRGVNDAQLVKYASHSDFWTQNLVELLTSKVPQKAAANLLRMIGDAGGVDELVNEGVGTPPPGSEPGNETPIRLRITGRGSGAPPVGAPPPER